MNISRKVLLPVIALLYVFSCPAYSGNTFCKRRTVVVDDQGTDAAPIARRAPMAARSVGVPQTYSTNLTGLLADALSFFSLDVVGIVASYCQPAGTDIPQLYRSFPMGLTHLDLSNSGLDGSHLAALKECSSGDERGEGCVNHGRVPLCTVEVFRFDGNRLSDVDQILKPDTLFMTRTLDPDFFTIRSTSSLRALNLARNPMGSIEALMWLVSRLETRHPKLVSLDLSSTSCWRGYRTLPAGHHSFGSLQELYFHGNPCDKRDLKHVFSSLRGQPSAPPGAYGGYEDRSEWKYLVLSLSVKDFAEAAPIIGEQLPRMVAVLIMPDLTEEQCQDLQQRIRAERDDLRARTCPGFYYRGETPITVRKLLPPISKDTGMPDGLSLLPPTVVARIKDYAKSDKDDEKRDR